MTRQHLRRRGAGRRAALGLAPGAAPVFDEMLHGAFWDRAVLGEGDRVLCALTVACVLGREREVQVWVPAALAAGLEASAIVELLLQCGLYGGFAVTESALTAASPLLESALSELQSEAESDEILADLETRASDFANMLHGTESDAGYDAPENLATRDLYEIVHRWGYGVIWQRPTLALRQRLLCALAAFTTLGIEPSLRKFASTALRHGLAPSEIREAILQTAPHCGFPRALAALAAIPITQHGDAR